MYTDHLTSSQKFKVDEKKKLHFYLLLYLHLMKMKTPNCESE